ncbi:MAG TPA: BlaI/MecI/CopY family transcriptional regulator [Candidatus Limnocylindrales bacterium]|nr:BlaI/MecI/CopY family transcriptional regulator [Candidatus Limnocylindrales bacterium]
MRRPDLRRLRRKGARGDDFLGPLEAAVMDLVWKRGEATVREMVDALGPSRALAYTTVMTIMTRLHEKGLLARRRDGRGYTYRPALTREQHRARLSRDLVRGLVNEFGDVALAQFAAELDAVDSGHRAALRKVAQREGRRGAR